MSRFLQQVGKALCFAVPGMLCLSGHANTPAWPHPTSPAILTTGAATTASLHNSFVALQQRSISGTVTGEDGEGLPGASVVVKGTTVGTTTDVMAPSISTFRPTRRPSSSPISVIRQPKFPYRGEPIFRLR